MSCTTAATGKYWLRSIRHSICYYASVIINNMYIHYNCVIFFTIANDDDLNVMEFKIVSVEKTTTHFHTSLLQSMCSNTSLYIKSESVIVSYRMYDTMIQCDRCDQRHHLRCVGVESPTLSQKWFCKECSAK